MTDEEEDRVYLAPEDLNDYLDLLDGGEERVRRQISGAVRGVDPRGPAVAHLERLVGGEMSPDAREAALTLMRHLGRPGVASLHRLALEAKHWETRAAALDVLGDTAPSSSCIAGAPSWQDYEKDVRTTCSQALQDDHPAVRTAALDALLIVWPKQAAIPQEILGTLSDSAGEVRAAAIRFIRHAIRHGGDLPESVPPLLSDPEEEVRLEAAWCVAGPERVSDEVVRTLIALVDSERVEIRARAATALGWCGPRASPAVPKIAPRLKTAEPSELRAYLGAMARIGPSAAPLVPQVADIVKSSAADLDELFFALSGVGSSATLALVEILGDGAEEKRYRAARGLKLIGPDARSALPALWKALEDPVARVRYRSAQAILVIDGSSTPRLMEYILSQGEFDRSHLLHYLAEEKKPALPLLREIAAKLPEGERTKVLQLIEQVSNPNPGEALP